MRKILAILAVLVGSAYAVVTPVTVTGDLSTVIGSDLKGNAKVCFRLRNYAGFAPRIIGQSTIPGVYSCAFPDADGHIATTLWGNDNISPLEADLSPATFYTFEFWNDGKVQFQPNFLVTGSTFNFNTASQLNPPPDPPTPLSGTVTSVGLALPASVFTISGSPVTTSGILTGTFITQTANQFFLGPASGSPAVPTFRTIVPLDLGTGSADATTCLVGNLTWITCPGGGSSSVNVNGAPVSNPNFNLTLVAPEKNYSNTKWQVSSSSVSAEQHIGANAEQFAWSSSPSGTISAGATTATLTSCPAGVVASANQFYVYISTVGTPEVVKVTGGTCAGNGSSGTLQFTAVNSHSVGYTIGTATAGVKEALTFVQTANIGQRVFLPPGSTNLFQGPLYVTSNSTRDIYNTMLDFTGALIQCAYTSASCINLGDPAVSSTPNSFITVLNARMQAVAAIGDTTHHYAAIEDNAQSSSIIGFRTRQRDTAGHYFRHLIINDNDQNLSLLEPKLTGDDIWGHCDTDWCSSFYYGPGGGNAGITRLIGGDLSLACNGNGIDENNANSFSASDTVIQAYSQFAVRYVGGFVNTATLNNVYMEAGGCTNPIYGAVAQSGLLMRNGRYIVYGGTGPSGVDPTFANNAAGATVYNYFIVLVNSSAQKSNPLFVGSSTVNSGTVTSITVKWPGTDYYTADIVSFDLLRISGSPGTTFTGPNGTASVAVATGLLPGTACTALVCTTTDTNAALTSYTVSAVLSPSLIYWPGGLVLSSNGDNTGGSSTNFGYYRGEVPQGQWINNTTPPFSAGGAAFAGGQNVALDPSTPSSNPFWTGPAPLFFNQSSGTYPQALILTTARTNGDANGLMGRLVFTNQNNNADIITLIDSNPPQTAASFGRAVQRAADAALGTDGTDRLAVRARTSLSTYINHVPTNGDTAWLTRLTSSLFSFQVPVTTNSQITSTLATGTAPFVIASTTNVPNLNASSLAGATFAAPGPIGSGTPGTGAFTTISANGQFTSTLVTGAPPIVVASTTTVPNLTVSNHPKVQFCGTTSTCSATATLSGQVVTGSAPLISGTPSTVTITAISPAFTSTSTYNCVATDNTAANAVFVTKVSGSSFTITGPDTVTDVVSFECSGN